MRALWLITAKDLRQRLRDKSLLLYAFLLPLGLTYVFGLTMGGAGGADAFEYAVVNADRGVAAERFLDQVLRPVEKMKIISLRTAATPEAGRDLVDRGEIDAAIVIPQGFSAAVENGAPTGLQVIGSVDAPISVEVARSLAASYAAELQSVRLSVATAGGTDPANAAELAERAAQAGAPVSIEDVSAATRQLDPDTYMAASMAVFFLFFSVQFGVTGVLEERQGGTLPRLLAAPIPRAAVLAGKLLLSLIIGVVSMAMLVIASSVLLDANWGDPIGVALLVVTGVLAATGVMAMVPALARTYEQAGQWQAVVAVALGALGGVFFSTDQIDGPLSKLGYITPHRWFLQGLADLAGGDGVSVVLPAAGVLAAFGLVTGGLAFTGLRKVVAL